MNTDIVTYLPDPQYGSNKSLVFVKTARTEDVIDWSSALRFLRDHQPSPLQLRVRPPVSGDAVLTVIVETCARPRILFGRSNPTGDSAADLAEIQRVLKAHGLTTVVVPESAV